MTFDELVSETADRLNLTSSDAITRIGKRINDRYRRVTSSIGVITSRRVITTITVDPTDTGSFPDLPYLTITEMEKVLRITTTAANGGILVLKEHTFDDITATETLTRVPRSFAVKEMGAGYVIIVLDSVTAVDTFPLTIEGYDVAEVLTGSQEPVIPTDFHDILVAGAMSDELYKMEKPQLAVMAEQKYESRLSDLRMFIAKSGYLDIAQGLNKPSRLWYQPWTSRISGTE